MSVRATWPVVVLCAGLLLPRAGRAQPAHEEGCAEGVEKGETLLTNGDLAGAERALAAAIRVCEKDPAFASARPYLALGKIYFERADYAAAVPHFEKALVHEPKLALAHMNLCAAYMQMGDFERAVASGQKALAAKDKPTKFKATYNLGLAHFKWAAAREDMKDVRSAKYFEDAIKLDPKFADSYFFLGMVELVQRNRPAKARPLFKKGCDRGHAGACKQLEPPSPADAPTE